MGKTAASTVSSQLGVPCKHARSGGGEGEGEGEGVRTEEANGSATDGSGKKGIGAAWWSPPSPHRISAHTPLHTHTLSLSALLAVLV